MDQSKYSNKNSKKNLASSKNNFWNDNDSSQNYRRDDSFFFNALLKYQLCQKYFTDIQKNLFQAQQKIYIRYVKMKKLCKNYNNVKNNILQFVLTSL